MCVGVFFLFCEERWWQYVRDRVITVIVRMILVDDYYNDNYDEIRIAGIIMMGMIDIVFLKRILTMIVMSLWSLLLQILIFRDCYLSRLVFLLLP